MPYRMKDVADRAGVSVTTVSHVLNNSRFVAPETRARILKAAKEMGYFKNAMARRLVRGRSDFYGLIVSDLRNPFFPEIISSFESTALERGFDLLLCNTNYNPVRAEAAVRKMIENNVQGVAVMTSEIPGHVTSALVSHQIATVFLDVGHVGRYTSNIRVDYAGGIYQAIDYLFRLGHRDFAFIAGPQNLRSAVVRRQAFLGALDRTNILQYRVLEGNHKVDGGMVAARALLEESHLATAILCSNDLTAIGANAVLQKAGLGIPRDISIIGFDDIDLASLVSPPLTTISLPRDELGKLAFNALEEILNAEGSQGSERVIETSLVIRESTAPTPQILVSARTA